MDRKLATKWAWWKGFFCLYSPLLNGGHVAQGTSNYYYNWQCFKYWVWHPVWQTPFHAHTNGWITINIVSPESPWTKVCRIWLFGSFKLPPILQIEVEAFKETDVSKKKYSLLWFHIILRHVKNVYQFTHSHQFGLNFIGKKEVFHGLL